MSHWSGLGSHSPLEAAGEVGNWPSLNLENWPREKELRKADGESANSAFMGSHKESDCDMNNILGEQVSLSMALFSMAIS